MNSHLPYRATAANGETIDVTFDLHVETRSEVDVSALLTALLDTIDARVADREGVSNGDVLQALAMAVALRVAMIPAPRTVTEPLARDLLDTALSCASFAQRVPATPPQPVPPPVVAEIAAPVVPPAPAPVVETAPAPAVETAPAPAVEPAPAPAVASASAPAVEPASAPAPATTPTPTPAAQA
jgi:outer membrane biosynthesis protein TonB